MRKGVVRSGAALFMVGVAGCSSAAVEPSQSPAPATAPASVAAQITFDQHVTPFFRTYCTGCHTGNGAPEGIALNFPNEEAARQRALSSEDFWSRVARNITSKQMPPPYADAKPTDEERTMLVDWINNNVLTANGMPDPGPFMVHRLNTREYANTIRDLLYLPPEFDVSSDFPADERGAGGFDNYAATLTISPLLIEQYLAVAERATAEAMGLDLPDEPRALHPSRLKLTEPSLGTRTDEERINGVRRNLQAFVPRAWRRPVSAEEIEELMRFARLSMQERGLHDYTFDDATALAIRAALLAPEFLFRSEEDPAPDGTNKVYELTEYQLASRLSYFLWSSMPDDSLFTAAREGTLRSNLEAQVARMLRDPKSISLTKDFVGQWLEIRGLHEVPNVAPELLEAMLGETEHFFDYIVRNDRSIMEFLDSDYTFVNEELARVYGLEGIAGDEFRRVPVDRARRGGIFTQASFLTLTSKPLGDTLRTSPVVRGKWILENIFNETIPPPPPDVPSLNIDQNQELKGTVRQIFEQHRADPVCAGCHARMDPYGFALENYDGMGSWRDQDNGSDVDASGEINGRSFTTPVEFRQILADRRDDFRIALVRKMLSYALGRSIQPSDRQAIDQVAAAVKADGDKFSSLIINIVRSYPFQHARSSAGGTTLTAPPAANTSELYHPAAPLPPLPAPPAAEAVPPGQRRTQVTPPGATAPAPAAAPPAAGR